MDRLLARKNNKNIKDRTVRGTLYGDRKSKNLSEMLNPKSKTNKAGIQQIVEAKLESTIMDIVIKFLVHFIRVAPNFFEFLGDGGEQVGL